MSYKIVLLLVERSSVEAPVFINCYSEIDALEYDMRALRYTVLTTVEPLRIANHCS